VAERRAAAGFVAEPDRLSEAAKEAYDKDRAELGYVMNATRLWAHDADSLADIFAVLGRLTEWAGLSDRDRGLLIAATTSTLGDSGCSFAWGGRLADAASPELSAAVLESRDDGLDERGRTLVGWARCVGRDPNTITQDDVDQLRDVGYHDRQIHAVTTFVALRLAFSTVNDAVGRPARPATGREGAHCGAISGGVRPAHRTGPEHELTQADGPCEPGGALCVRHGDGVHYA